MARHLLIAALWLYYVAVASARPEECRPDTAESLPKVRQCTWVNLNSDVDEGEIASCVIDKRSDVTALRMTWHSTIRTTAEKHCNRWFFKINGEECRTPTTIDTAINTSEEWTYMRPATVDGICTGIPAGQVTVTINVGACSNPGDLTTGDTRTGAYSTSRMLLEEVHSVD